MNEKEKKSIVRNLKKIFKIINKSGSISKMGYKK